MQDKYTGSVFLVIAEDAPCIVGTKIAVKRQENGPVGAYGTWSGNMQPFTGSVTLSSED